MGSDLGKTTVAHRQVTARHHRWPWILIGYCCLVLLATTSSARGDELAVNAGFGPQPGADQNNRSAGIDYIFYEHRRSARSSFHLGVSSTYLETHTSNYRNLHAVSIFPQLSLYPAPGSWARSLLPPTVEPFFYVRALGPSYISANRLGSRRQDKHFAFQALIGVGAVVQLSNDRDATVSVAWKHFSNANLFNDNDGIDVPFALNVGIRF